MSSYMYTIDHKINMEGVPVNENSRKAQILQLFAWVFLIQHLFHLLDICKYTIGFL